MHDSANRDASGKSTKTPTGNESRRLDRLGVQLPALRTGYVPAGRDIAKRSRDLQQGRDSIRALDPLDDAGAGGTVGGAANVVGSDGKLNAMVKHASWAAPSAFPTVLKSENGSTSILLDSTGLTINDGTETCTILFAALTKNMSLREIDVCDGGVAKKMLVLASEPY